MMFPLLLVLDALPVVCSSLMIWGADGAKSSDRLRSSAQTGQGMPPGPAVALLPLLPPQRRLGLNLHCRVGRQTGLCELRVIARR